MAYEKIVWDGSLMLTPANLRHMETQIDEAAGYINQNLRQANDRPLRAEVAASAPTGAAGRFYFNSTDGKIYGHNGTAWGAWA